MLCVGCRDIQLLSTNDINLLLVSPNTWVGVSLLTKQDAGYEGLCGQTNTKLFWGTVGRSLGAGSRVRAKRQGASRDCFHYPQCRIKGLRSRLEQGLGTRLEPPAKISKNVGRSQQSGKKQLGIVLVFFLNGVSDSWFLCIKLNHPRCSSRSLKDSEVTKLAK